MTPFGMSISAHTGGTPVPPVLSRLVSFPRRSGCLSLAGEPGRPGGSHGETRIEAEALKFPQQGNLGGIQGTGCHGAEVLEIRGAELPASHVIRR